MAVKSFFETFPGRVRIGWVRPDGVDSDRANSAQVQMNFATRAERGNKVKQVVSNNDISDRKCNQLLCNYAVSKLR